MARLVCFILFYLAVFLQAGAYGLTFLLPDLFATFGASEKTVGAMLSLTAVATLIIVYYSGHLSDVFGRVMTLALACLCIAISLAMLGLVKSEGYFLASASILLGIGWGLTYALAPVVLARLVRRDERVRTFALLSIFVMAGFGLSPVMTSFMEKSGYQISDAYFVSATFCLFSAVIFVALIGPIRNLAINEPAETASRLTLSSIRGILKSPAVLPVAMVFFGASVFAGMTNFQTVIAGQRGLDYAGYFLTYTVTVVLFRILLLRFSGGSRPYVSIAVLQYIMAASVALFIVSGGNSSLYILVAVLFGLGYGASYPILVAMAANDADTNLVPQTLQLFALTYFIGIFGFPLIAGWITVELGATSLLILVVALAMTEARLALIRGLQK